MSSILPESQAEIIRSPEGTVHLWSPRPGFLVTRVSKSLTSRALLAMDRAFRAALSNCTTYNVFHDWEQMTDYHPDTRDRLLGSSRDFKAVTQRHHMLVGSKIVAFGLRAASLVAPGFHAYPDRAAFEKALEAGFKSAPIP
jgi:hypothetical protein